jgi:Prokaryotic homologs of the JAB domain
MSTGEFAKYCVQRVIARAETCFSPSTCFRVIGMSLDAVTGSRADFLRNPETHRRTPNEFSNVTGREDQRFNYLSEWHSHSSFSARPSATDMAAAALTFSTPIRKAQHRYRMIHARPWRQRRLS